MKQIENAPYYFAAANSYGGFISYFDRIFGSENFDRVFVLKGGPGTGKSSFMKRLAHTLSESGAQLELFRCSSDPSSLDGVIAESTSGRIAVVDGTAPHERDAIIPGAVDEIINLGENWNERWLRAERSRIEPLCHEKSRAYRTAYYYLSLAGHAAERMLSLAKSELNEKKLVSSIKSLAESIILNVNDKQEGKSKLRLIGAVGKSGRSRLDTLERISKRKFTIRGSEEQTLIFITRLAE